MNNQIKIAGQDNVSIISSSWCANRSGICLSFAISIQVMSIDEIQEFGKQFVKAVKQSYGNFIDEYFYAKTDSPIVSATPDGQIIMLWSFQGQDDKRTRQGLKEYKIEQIKYN